MSDEKRIIELDSLRGIAAMLVFIFHFKLFVYGCTGVDLFFIISGFVIFMTLDNSNNINQFWLSRIIRLYPAYWLSIIIAIISFTVFGRTNLFLSFLNLKDGIGNLLMVQPLLRSDCLVSAYWTLYIELTFYLFISILWRINGFKNVEIILFVLLILSLVSNTLQVCIGDSNTLYVHFYIVLRGLLPIMLQFQLFAAGMIFYKIYWHGFTTFRISILILTLCIVIPTHQLGGNALFFMNVYQHLGCDVIFYLLFILLCLKRLTILKGRIGVFAGGISYLLYLIHESSGIQLKNYLIGSVPLFVADVIPMLLCILLAWILERKLDYPLRKWLKKKFGSAIGN